MSDWPIKFANEVAEKGCPGRRIKIWRDKDGCHVSAILEKNGMPSSETKSNAPTYEAAVLQIIRELAMRERERITREAKRAERKYPRFRNKPDADAWMEAMKEGSRAHVLEISPFIPDEGKLVPNPDYDAAHIEATLDEDSAPLPSMLAEMPPKFRTMAEAEAWIREQRSDRRPFTPNE